MMSFLLMIIYTPFLGGKNVLREKLGRGRDRKWREIE